MLLHYHIKEKELRRERVKDYLKEVDDVYILNFVKFVLSYSSNVDNIFIIFGSLKYFILKCFMRFRNKGIAFHPIVNISYFPYLRYTISHPFHVCFNLKFAYPSECILSLFFFWWHFTL